MANVVPTLSSAGWISTPEVMLMQIISQYCASDAEQSNIYDVYSMYDRTVKYGKNPYLLVRHIKEDLTKLINQTFGESSIDVSFNMRDEVSYDLNIKASAKHNGSVVATNASYEVYNGEIKQVS